MQKHGEYEDGEAFKLNQEFKQTLAEIRPYIVNLRSNEGIQLCKAWLDKLCNLSTQPLLRNQYLVELRKQLESGCLHGIFSRPPSPGFLLPLSKLDYTMCVSSSVSDLSEYNSKHCEARRQWRGRRIYYSPTPLRRVYPHNIPAVMNNRSYRSVNMSRSVRFRDENESERRGRKAHLCLDESPRDIWSEDQYSVNCNELNAEIYTLKAKLIEVEKANGILESSQREIVWYYHNLLTGFFTDLKLQLEECSCDRNKDDLLQRVCEIVQGKEDEVREAEKLLMDKLKTVCKEYENSDEMKDFFEKESDGLAEEAGHLMKKIQDLETKMVTKNRDEDKLQLMLEEQNETIKEVFSKMKIVVDLTRQKENQRLACTISSLKKALAKSEKSRFKLGIEFEKKIINITKSRDLEISSLQLQLQEQKNELSSSLSSEKQCEVDSIVNLLEERYKTLLSKAQTEAEKQHLEDRKKIALLEDEIRRLKRAFTKI